MSKSKVTESVTESVTRSPIEIFWTAKKTSSEGFYVSKKKDFAAKPNILPENVCSIHRKGKISGLAKIGLSKTISLKPKTLFTNNRR